MRLIISIVSLLAIVSCASGLHAAPTFRTWENHSGQTFTGSIVDSDGATATFNIRGGGRATISLSDLKPEDQREAILTVFEPKYQKAVRHLQSEVNKTTKDIFLEPEHVPHLNDIGIYLKELVRPVTEKFKPEGEFEDSDDYWTRVHSGMVYYAMTWLGELSNHGQILKLGEARRPKLKDTLRHVQNFYDFFVQIHQGKNYFASKLGQQFPVKFKPKDYINDQQPYHYWVYLPQDYNEAPLPLVMFFCGRGEFGTSLDAVLTNELPKLLEARKDYPFIVVSPQDNDDISRPAFFNEILNDAKRRFKMDEDRVIATGLSSGGNGVWRWALSNPELLAGIVPVCATAPFLEVQQLKDMPIWIFNNEYDKIWAQEIPIANMRSVNPNFKYTIFAGAKGHNAWSKAYIEKGLEEWMAKLNRKNNKSNSDNPLAAFALENALTAPAVKTESMGNYLSFAFDPSPKDGKYATVLGAHRDRYGASHDAYLFDALNMIYNFQHFDLKQSCTPAPIRFLDTKKPNEHIFGIKITSFQRVDIKAPFELKSRPSFKNFSAYYVSENELPDAALSRLRRMASEAGHTLTGNDRIVYHQMLFAEKNVYELQIGIR